MATAPFRRLLRAPPLPREKAGYRQDEEQSRDDPAEPAEPARVERPRAGAGHKHQRPATATRPPSPTQLSHAR